MRNDIEENKARVLEMLEKSLGVITTACKAANISRQSFYRYVNEDEEFASKVRDIENVSLDYAESQLFTLMKGGNAASVIFYLKTKGRNRGYIENPQQQVNIQANGELNIEVKSGEDEEDVRKFIGE